MLHNWSNFSNIQNMNTFPDVLPSDMMECIAIKSEVDVGVDVDDVPVLHYAKSEFSFMKITIIHPKYVDIVIEGIIYPCKNSVSIKGSGKSLKRKDIKFDDFTFPNLADFLKK
eukprot:NODE_61_length_25240_cov_0.547194.p15 type:complete len:113 gc:universal NODE_61_length_25240_cov_0.547194:5789-5451(-)